MKKLMLLTICAAILSVIMPASAQTNKYLLKIIPQPVECNLSPSYYVPFTQLTIYTDDTEAVAWAEKHLAQWYKKEAPKVFQKSYTGKSTKSGAYSININSNGVVICAKELEGVRYALYSLRQIAIPERNTLKVEGWIVPVGAINDYPTMKFRGMHICWFPETEEFEIERMIRMAAYYKLNYVVLEPWGTYRSKVAPWLNWDEAPITKKSIKRLVAIAKELGVTIIPQLNIFGHASQSRSRSAKHSAIDQRPCYQPLFEPMAGWNWCLSNPKAKEVIEAVMVEMLEDFGNPEFFHIGCDEAQQPSCPECLKQPYSKLFVEHIKFAHDVLAKHGARAMMWQDMLLEKGDKRWTDYKANGTAETAKAAEEMPKDIVICDWHYRAGRKDYPSYSYFKELGYDLLACPWKNVSGIVAEARAIENIGAFGMLGTIWHHYYGYDIASIYTNIAGATWNPSANFAQHNGFNLFKTHQRHISWDMKLKKYYQFGIQNYQIPDNKATYK